MTVRELILACALAVTLIALGLTAYEVWGLPRRRRACVVNLSGDSGVLTGMLWARRGPWVVLKNASFVAHGSVIEQRIPGEAMVDKARIDWIQVEP